MYTQRFSVSSLQLQSSEFFFIPTSTTFNFSKSIVLNMALLSQSNKNIFKKNISQNFAYKTF